MFDIDWMAGMSAGVFTLTNTDVKSVMAELDKIIGDKNLSPLAGILRIIPIERMNALLVVTPQASYLDEVKKWIDRLDKGGGGGGELQFYVVQPVQPARGKAGAALAAGIHRPFDAADGALDAYRRAWHAGRPDRQSADVHADQSGYRRQHA